MRMLLLLLLLLLLATGGKHPSHGHGRGFHPRNLLSLMTIWDVASVVRFRRVRRPLRGSGFTQY